MCGYQGPVAIVRLGAELTQAPPCLREQLVQRSIDELIVWRIHTPGCCVSHIEGIGRSSAFGIRSTAS
jgi:hypothetical protein